MVFVLVVFLGFPIPCCAQHTAFSWDWKKDQYLRPGETIDRIHLPAIDHRSLQRALAKEFEGFLATEKPARTLITQVVSHALVRIVNLKSDQSPQILVQAGDLDGGCSPTGNCPIWIFRKVGPAYRTILNSHGQTFQILHGPGKEFADFMVGRHGSAFEKDLLIYHFSDDQYQQSACFNAVFDQQETGTKPRVTKCR